MQRRNFESQGAIIATFFSRVFFSGELILIGLRIKKGTRGFGGMLPRKIFEDLHAVMAILVLFEQFSRKFCLNFLTLFPSAFPIMMHFVATPFMMHFVAPFAPPPLWLRLCMSNNLKIFAIDFK